MTRIISFSDSFSSASAPDIAGGSQEDYAISNNQSSAANILTIDAVNHKSAFISFELERSDSIADHRQVGHIIISYDGTSWNYSLGSYAGDSVIEASLLSSHNITLNMTTTLGVGSLKYTSGNMGGTGYVGNIRMFITRILTA